MANPFQGQHLGMGRFAKQLVDKGGVQVSLSPELRKRIKEQSGLTDDDIDQGILAGGQEFIERCDRAQAENAQMLTPPREDVDVIKIFVHRESRRVIKTKPGWAMVHISLDRNREILTIPHLYNMRNQCLIRIQWVDCDERGNPLCEEES